jgi:streptogramin lyase
VRNSVNSLGSTDTEAYTYVTQWGTTGLGNREFDHIQGIAIDTSDNVYITDAHNSRVQKLKSNGTYITQWGTNGSGIGQFYYTRGIAVDPLGNVYVADSSNYRIQKFNPNGTYITQWGTFGFNNGQFVHNADIATDSWNNVYVTEYVVSDRIQKFSSEGRYISQWGTTGSGNGQLNFAHGIATDVSGNVYAVDSWNNRIQKFNSDGTYISQWGTYGTGNGQFDHPYGIAIDSSGNVFITDSFNSRVQMFNSEGTYLAQWGTYGTGNGQFDFPYAIAVDLSGNVYVSDDINRIQVFKPTEKVVEKTFSITNNWINVEKHQSKLDNEVFTNIKNGLSGWTLTEPGEETHGLAGPEITKKYFGGISSGPSSSINDATLHWHFGHGVINPTDGHIGLQLLKTNSTVVNGDYETYEMYASDVQNKWGGNNKWVVLQSCLVLSDPDWGETLGTTHGILGYYTTTEMGSHIDSRVPERFFAFVKSGDPLYDSWRKATVDVYSGYHGGKVIKDSEGHFVLYRTDEMNITAAVRFKTDKQKDNDHLPGYGLIEPDDVSTKKSILTKWDCGSGDLI